MILLCLAIALHDLDGPILCRGGVKLRLQGIGATELDGTCRRGQPCVPGDPFAQRRRMAAAIGATIAREDRRPEGHAWFAGPVRLRYQPTGTSYGRVTAWVTLPDGRDASCAAIAAGVAARWARFDPAGRLTGCGRAR